MRHLRSRKLCYPSTWSDSRPASCWAPPWSRRCWTLASYAPLQSARKLGTREATARRDLLGTGSSRSGGTPPFCKEAKLVAYLKFAGCGISPVIRNVDGFRVNVHFFLAWGQGCDISIISGSRPAASCWVLWDDLVFFRIVTSSSGLQNQNDLIKKGVTTPKHRKRI